MNCHICESADTRVLDAKLEVNVCENCEHEFSALLPERQETYSPEYFREMHKRWFLYPNTELFGRINKAVEKVAREAGHGISFLDVGCGEGHLLRYMRDAGNKAALHGIDLVSNSDAGVTYYRGDFLTFPFGKTFDVVSGCMVIEHVGDPHGFVRKIRSALKPNGVVIMNTINASGFLYSLARFLREVGFRGPFERLYHKHHLEHYKTSSLRKLFETEEFRVISHRTHNFPLKALDVPEGNRTLAFMYRTGIACVFALTALWGGVHQTIIVQKTT